MDLAHAVTDRLPVHHGVNSVAKLDDILDTPAGRKRHASAAAEGVTSGPVNTSCLRKALTREVHP
jgi:hypothetical protein